MNALDKAIKMCDAESFEVYSGTEKLGIGKQVNGNNWCVFKNGFIVKKGNKSEVEQFYKQIKKEGYNTNPSNRRPFSHWVMYKFKSDLGNMIVGGFEVKALSTANKEEVIRNVERKKKEIEKERSGVFTNEEMQKFYKHINNYYSK